VGTGWTIFAIGIPLLHTSFDLDFWHINLMSPTTDTVPAFLHVVPESEAPAIEILHDKSARINVTTTADFLIPQ